MDMQTESNKLCIECDVVEVEVQVEATLSSWLLPKSLLWLLFIVVVVVVVVAVLSPIVKSNKPDGFHFFGYGFSSVTTEKVGDNSMSKDSRTQTSPRVSRSTQNVRPRQTKTHQIREIRSWRICRATFRQRWLAAAERQEGKEKWAVTRTEINTHTPQRGTDSHGEPVGIRQSNCHQAYSPNATKSHRKGRGGGREDSSFGTHS